MAGGKRLRAALAMALCCPDLIASPAVNQHLYGCGCRVKEVEHSGGEVLEAAGGSRSGGRRFWFFGGGGGRKRVAAIRTAEIGADHSERV